MQLRIGGVSIEIDAGNHGEMVLLQLLGLFRADFEIPDIRLNMIWVESLDHPISTALFDSGSVWRLYESGAEFRFDFIAESLDTKPYKSLTVDRDFRRGELSLSRQFFARPGRDCIPLQYPLDELLIMHRLTQEKAIELHGTGIARANGDANLFVGHSGAGKSTTTRLWTDVEDVEVLSDDRIIVRRDEDAAFPSTPREAFGNVGRHRTVRVRDCSASPTDLPAQDDNERAGAKTYQMRMYGTPWHGEAMFASPNSVPLTRIFVLEHGHGNVITPLPPRQAVAELFARSFVPFHRHEYVDSALVFLEELVDAVPVYRYAFEPDRRAVDKLLRFHD